MDELESKLRLERLRSVQTNSFFVILRHCFGNASKYSAWVSLAEMHYGDDTTARLGWQRFEADCLRLSDYLEAVAESEQPPCSIDDCLAAAADYVRHEEYGAIWNESNSLLRAQALFGLVSASANPLLRVLETKPKPAEPPNTQLPTAKAMREALCQAGDLNGCLMV